MQYYNYYKIQYHKTLGNLLLKFRKIHVFYNNTALPVLYLLDHFHCLDKTYNFFFIYSVNVLFTFDKEFRSAFGDEGMTQVIALVKNAYKDNSLASKIGTSVNIKGEATTYSGTFTNTDL